ncbi:erythromycin esterase family protein [Kitasatospora sp. NPDC056651]|uniref:erythromycin esterase family protein n=1 Tax=Kitasatospora sp. NPDC056651 TaxID=3345892 RepID=UPI0036BBD6F3
MNQDMDDFVTPECELLGLGEPTHQEPAFGWVRNELFARLAVDRGFRSIALETDRVAAFAVDAYVREGVGTFESVMAEGFTHGFGGLAPNRRLVAWMREFNRERPPGERLAFHGFDIPTETTSAPSPRSYLQGARDYLGLDLDLDLGLNLAAVADEDERWSREESVMDPARSPGGTADAVRLRCIADDLLLQLHMRAPRLIASTSLAEWYAARTRLAAGIGLLRYHAQSAVPGLSQGARVGALSGVRDALMAQNLLDIREIEERRGPTLLFTHNLHAQRNPSSWTLGDLHCEWTSAGHIVGALLGERYAFVAGSLGRSEAIGLAEPAPGTYEGHLRRSGGIWALTAPDVPAEARARTDTVPRQGYFPLDREILDGAVALLHIADGAVVPAGD